MTEHEKMLAGELYSFMDDELQAIRQRAKNLMYRYNLSQDDLEKQNILQQLVGRLGTNTLIEAPFQCTYGCHTYLGDNSYLNFNCVILDNNEVHIGHNVMVGPAAQFYTAIHPLDAVRRIQLLETTKPIVIEDNVWIGGGAIILPGVTVGINSVVGAGAVVTKAVPPNVVVAGNPARVIKKL